MEFHTSIRITNKAKNYPQQFRVGAAKKLLEEGKLRVSDVAEAVGVHDVKYFGRLFKKAVGLTPGEYQEKNRKL